MAIIVIDDAELKNVSEHLRRTTIGVRLMLSEGKWVIFWSRRV
jgi:hypothetical protein